MLFRSLHGVMKPGAVLEAQCGGDGNIAEVERAVEALAGDERFRPISRNQREAWNYASVGDTELRLQRGGLLGHPRLDAPTPGRAEGPVGYVSTVILPWHLHRLPPELHDEFERAVIETAPRPLTITYIRLNISATA